jgi:hypothetical protein
MAELYDINAATAAAAAAAAAAVLTPVYLGLISVASGGVVLTLRTVIAVGDGRRCAN